VEAQELLAASRSRTTTTPRRATKPQSARNGPEFRPGQAIRHLDWLADKKDSAWDPHDARGYETGAHFFMLNRRYPESIEFYRKAIALDPELYTAARRWRST